VTEAEESGPLVICFPVENPSGLSRALIAVPRVRNAVSRHRALVTARANPLNKTDLLQHVLDNLHGRESSIGQVLLYGDSNSFDLHPDALREFFPSASISTCSDFHQLRSQLRRSQSVVTFYPDPLGLGQTPLELRLKLARIEQIAVNSRGRNLSGMQARLVASRVLANTRAADALLGALVVAVAVFLKAKDQVGK
jgi:hypothetical protein